MGACSESKQRRKREQREKNESERVYRKEDKIEERAVIGINKEIDGTSISRELFSTEAFARHFNIFDMLWNSWLHYWSHARNTLSLTISYNFYYRVISISNILRMREKRKILVSHYSVCYQAYCFVSVHKSRTLIIGDISGYQEARVQSLDQNRWTVKN